MKRILLVTLALVMAAMMLAMAMPAFAEASPQANCVGRAFSGEEPATKGQLVRAAATAVPGLVGDVITAGS